LEQTLRNVPADRALTLKEIDARQPDTALERKGR
jgi:hypothetical protein